MDYINNKRFTALFRHRRKNHKEICSELHRLVSTLADLPNFRPAEPDLLDDAKQSTTLHCIERIHKFKFTPAGNAFSFFTTVASRELRHFRTKASKGRMLPLIVREDARDVNDGGGDGGFN